MGGFRKPSFWEEVRDMDRKSPDYKSTVKRYMEIAAAQDKINKDHHRMVLLIMELLAPTKRLQVSRLKDLNRDALIEIGKAARILNQSMQKHGLVTRENAESKWKE